MTEMEGFLRTLFSIIMSKGRGHETSSQKIDTSQAELAVLILRKLFGEIVTRQVARELQEFQEFCSCLSNGSVASISPNVASSLIDRIKSDDIDNISNDGGASTVDFQEIVNAVWLSHSSAPDNAYITDFAQNYHIVGTAQPHEDDNFEQFVDDADQSKTTGENNGHDEGQDEDRDTSPRSQGDYEDEGYEEEDGGGGEEEGEGGGEGEGDGEAEEEDEGGEEDNEGGEED